MVENEEPQIKSKYSSGINIIIRLDILWKDTHLHSRADFFYKWNNDLDCIWRELARDLKETDYKLWKDKLKFIDDGLKESGKFNDSEPDGFEIISKEHLEKREAQYNLLNEKQLILARLENELGKGTTQDDEGDDDFD